MNLETKEHIVATLLFLYSFQEQDEQIVKTTAYKNGRGFNSNDANICSDMAQFFLRRGYLTPAQIAYLQRTLKKYHGQVPENLKPISFSSNPQEKKEPPKTSRTATLDSGMILIRFSYSSDLVEKVKTLDGRRWNSQGKFWTALLSVDTVEKLTKWEFSLSPSLKEWYDKKLMPVEKTKINNIPGLLGEPRPFQLQGVEFIESRGGNTLIADEMGLGKSLQALAWLVLHPEKRPALIICPATLKYNWKNEIHKWMGAKISVAMLEGRKDFQRPKADITIINYDILANIKETPKTGWADYLKDWGYQVIIVDECHYIKESKTLRTKAVSRICKSIPHKMLLSGTPFTSRPKDGYTAINIVDPALFPSWWVYAKRYCNAKHNGYGWDFSGASNTTELHKKLTSTIMLRRLKKDVLKELPPKIRTIIPLEITNHSTYDRAEQNFLGYMKEIDSEKAERAGRAEQLAKIEALKQLCWEGKKKAVIEWVKDFLETGQKLVLFSTHTKVLDTLEKEFKGITARIDGTISNKTKRQAEVDKFQNDPNCALFLGNLQAAGVGITLTAAAASCTVELGWVPGHHIQAEDRIHRIGQEADCVQAYYLVGLNTIEESIMELLERKANVLDQILDGKEVNEGSMFEELLKELKK